MIDNEKAIAAALKEMERLGNVEINLKLPLPDIMIMVAHVQLALRHPAKTVSGRRAHSVCDSIIAGVELLSADLASFMRLGYDEKYDVAQEVTPP